MTFNELTLGKWYEYRGIHKDHGESVAFYYYFLSKDSGLLAIRFAFLKAGTDIKSFSQFSEFDECTYATNRKIDAADEEDFQNDYILWGLKPANTRLLLQCVFNVKKINHSTK